jgi:hypothetical protein
MCSLLLLLMLLMMLMLVLELAWLASELQPAVAAAAVRWSLAKRRLQGLQQWRRQQLLLQVQLQQPACMVS